VLCALTDVLNVAQFALNGVFQGAASWWCGAAWGVFTYSFM